MACGGRSGFLECRVMIRHAALFIGIFLASAVVTFANHGPATSGGGTYTISGETLEKGKFDLSLRTDFTQYESVSVLEAEERAVQSGEFDALEQAYIATISGAYGLADDIQIGASVGYYYGSSFIDSEFDGSTIETGFADPKGWTDLSLSVKWRMISGEPGNLSLVLGFILPTGTSHQRLSNGELIEASSQPGVNAFSVAYGVAYSRYLTSQITVDSSAVYTARTTADEEKIGDRFDFGLALAYRLTESIRKFPNYSIVGEVNAVWIGEDVDQGITNENTGGWTLYLSPGFRVRFSEMVSLTIEPSFPVVQNLNGDQIDAQWKLAMVLDFSF